MTSDKRPSSSGIPNFPELEETVLDRWRRDKIFEQALKQTEHGERFVFFEGPPTANGNPGIHHVLPRIYKDVIPRYKTMRGFFVERKSGWDTHGLPVELEVEKKLGLKSKRDIEAYGIERFNQECKKSVWQYKEDFEKLTERIGYWVDQEHPYITYETPYIESLWWILKKVWEKDLLYQGHKVVPHCPRCGTSLSSHEVAQGYKKIKDDSVFVKFKIKNAKGKVKEGDYILSWTTTPWTLPGNVALAVGEDMDYVRLRPNADGETFILAQARAEAIFGIRGEGDSIKGSELIGLEYEALFPGAIPTSTPGYENAFKVYAADFVTTGDGTGVVHTAVMYGEDDYKLGEAVGLPKVHTVNENGTFNDLVPDWKGWPVKHKDKPTEKKTTDAILAYLKERNLLYKEEPYEHDYPFCWRCDTPLLYYAKNSWFIKMSALREKLQASNANINWIPEHIKEGRFGGWLDEVKDWAISRERYWGTPLPLWECESCKEQLVVGGMEDLEKHAPPKTRFILMRHGEAENNTIGVVSSEPEKKEYHLTEKGKSDVARVAEGLKNQHVDLIVASPILRTQETAKIMAEVLGLPVTTDERLREIAFGDFNGKRAAEFEASFADEKGRFQVGAHGGGESWNEVKRRIVAFLREVRSQHPGKTILVVTHGDPIWVAESAIHQLSEEESLTTTYPHEGGFRELEMKNLPYGDLGEIDPHRPYIDEVTLQCPKCQQTMRRVKEVCDGWFDSGAMPYAQWHYPFEEKERIDAGTSFPADYIAEGMDQTRGWFYTLLAVATLLDKPAPYKNVICLGLILDAKGQKMSKSRGNVVDPWEVIREYGADPLRLLFFTMNQPGEYKLFDPKQVGEVVRKTFLILWNVVSFWRLYAADAKKADAPEARHLMDQWALQRTAQLVTDMTQALDTYDVTNAGRQAQQFITELSTWYVRRSRARFKALGQEQSNAVATLTTCLNILAKLLAPLTPMLADALYEQVGGKKVSVHLESWPRAVDIFPEGKTRVLEHMATTRSVVELGHALREEAKIRVRQPLSQLVVVGAQLDTAFLEILRDELNVHDVIIAQALPSGVDWKPKTLGTLSIALDTTITDELMAEGWFREVVRFVNDLRKKAGFSIHDRVAVKYHTENENVEKMLSFFHEKLMKETRADKIEKTSADTLSPLQLGSLTLHLGIGSMKNEE